MQQRRCLKPGGDEEEGVDDVTEKGVSGVTGRRRRSDLTETMMPCLSHAEDLESCKWTAWPGDKEVRESLERS